MTAKARSMRSEIAQLATAHHEACHALVAWDQEVAMRRLSSEPDGSTVGFAAHINPLKGINPEWDARPVVRHRIEKAIRILLAGGIAQRKFNARSYRKIHDREDLSNAVVLIVRIASPGKHADAYMQLLYIEAEMMVNSQWNRIRAVARELRERRTMNGKEAVAAIIVENERDFSEKMAGRNAATKGRRR